MPRRGWRSSRSKIASSSSIERPIVPPAPAVFSISSQVVSVERSRTRSSAGATRSMPASRPAPWCEPTCSTTPSASIADDASIVRSIVSTLFE
jgi:hypothetical protein